MARSQLSCCLVVRNESEQISDCLDCITILADEIVIVDTGSTDGTISTINKWAKKNGALHSVKLFEVGDQFHDEDNDFDFGAAKTFAIKSGTKDFSMWMDATDRVTDQKEIKKAFIDITNKNKNVYFALPTALSKEFAFIRTRIGPRDQSSLVGRIHEYMGFSDPKKLTRHFIAHPIMNQKVSRDLDRNLRQLLKEWKERPSSRICFYIGLTYRELNNLNSALEWFRRRIFSYGFDNEFAEEYFKSLETVTEILLTMPKNDMLDLEIYDMATQMIEKEPTRFEGYYYMGKYHYRRKEYNKAISYFRKYTKCKKPTAYKLWLNGAIYNGKAILNAIEECKTAEKYAEVLEPDEILDLHPRSNAPRSTFTRGDDQYY